MEKQIKYLMRKRIQSDFSENYSSLTWFTAEEAEKASADRESRLKTINDITRKTASNTKFYRGVLSKGCQICVSGHWGCNFINRLCNRDCFYCPQDRSITSEVLPHTDGLEFNDPAQHLAFIKTFEITGVGITGGEPLLEKSRVLSHIQAIKNEFRDDVYVWLYTNGTLVSKEIIQKLKDAGLDEIRFDISANHYALEPLRIAKGQIPVITVEIPLIPEDLSQLKALIPLLIDLKIDHLNLHQLFIAPNSAKSAINRKYHLSHDFGYPLVYESEMCALELFKWIEENRLPINLHYCSGSYKSLFQEQAYRRRILKRHLPPHMRQTKNGFLNNLRLHINRKTFKTIEKAFNEAGVDPKTYFYEPSKGNLVCHPNLWRRLVEYSDDIQLLYYEPEISLIEKNLGFTEHNYVINPRQYYEQKHLDEFVLACWDKIYISRSESKSAQLKHFKRGFPIQTIDDTQKMQHYLDFLNTASFFEEEEAGLQEIY